MYLKHEKLILFISLHVKYAFVQSIKKNETPLLISLQIIIQKRNWYQSPWIGLLQFDALKYFLGLRLHGESLSNFNIFNVNLQFFNEIMKFTSKIAWKQIFTTFLILVSDSLDVGIIANASF